MPQAICDVDPTFVVEIALFADVHGGKRAQARMQGLIMGALPSVERECSVATSLENLKSIKDQDEYKLGDLTVRNFLNGVVEMLSQLQAGSGPKIKSLNDEWSARLHAVLPLFCAATGDDGAKLRGLDAYKYKLEKAKSKEKSHQLHFDDLGDLHTYEFLATPALVAEVHAVTEKLLQGTKTNTRKRHLEMEGASSSTAVGKKSKKHKKDNTAAAEIESLFS